MATAAVRATAAIDWSQVDRAATRIVRGIDAEGRFVTDSSAVEGELLVVMANGTEQTVLFGRAIDERRATLAECR